MTLIKALCTDFVVRELDKQERPIVIDSYADPMKEEFQSFLTFLEPDFKIGEVDFSVLLQLTLSEDTISALKSFIEKQETGSVFEFPAPEEKEDRTQLYEFLNSLGLPILEAGTYESRVHLKFHGKVRMPKMQGKLRYLHFTLEKRNMDTETSIMTLCQYLPFYARHFKPSDFSCAGLKDKRGVTTQRICVKNKDAWPSIFLESASKSNLSVGDFEFSNERISLGSHGGNEFEVCFRNVSNCDEFILNCISLSKLGFPNKFGPERFGTCSVKTDEIGLMILREDFCSAFEAIVLTAVESNARDFSIDGESTYERYENASNLIKNKKIFNRQAYYLLQDVSDDMDQDQCREALLTLPHDNRTLYFHAFESKVFNELEISKELELGDVVSIDSQITSITEDNIDEFTIYDRVGPLIGFNSYAKDAKIFNLSSQVILQTREILREYDVEIEELPSKAPEFISPGGWRKLLNEPVDINLTYRAHNDVMEEFPIESRIFCNPEELDTTKKAQYASIIAKFKLPPSVYATQLIAEILGEEYNIQNQKRLMEDLQVLGASGVAGSAENGEDAEIDLDKNEP